MFPRMGCTKETNGLQHFILSLWSTVDAQTDANFVVTSTVASVACSFLSFAKVFGRNEDCKTEVCANYMGGARVSSPSEIYVLSLSVISAVALSLSSPHMSEPLD